MVQRHLSVLDLKSLDLCVVYHNKQRKVIIQPLLEQAILSPHESSAWQIHMLMAENARGRSFKY